MPDGLVAGGQQSGSIWSEKALTPEFAKVILELPRKYPEIILELTREYAEITLEIPLEHAGGVAAAEIAPPGGAKVIFSNPADSRAGCGIGFSGAMWDSPGGSRTGLA